MQLFSPLFIQWRGKGEVVSLIKYEPESKQLYLKGKSLLCGFYLNELIMKLTHRNDPNEVIFIEYGEALKRLSDNTQLDHVLRYFELKLLDELGYGVPLEFEAETGSPIEEDRLYEYILEQGPIYARPTSTLTISGQTLLALANGGAMNSSQLHEAKILTRNILNYYLGNAPIKSRDLFRKTH